MIFGLNKALLDTIVLSVVSKHEDGIYGYKITKDVQADIDISNSTLYPVLRRLQKEEYLETYDVFVGKMCRRYYRITKKGKVKLKDYYKEWLSCSGKISKILQK